MISSQPPAISIRKASGEEAVYDRDKLVQSLGRSGAGDEVIAKVVAEVEDAIHIGMSTRKIYRKAFQVLRKVAHSASVQYKLKEAIMALGPSGYPFEKFVGRLFEKMHYDVRVGETIQGLCVKHEVDILARGIDRMLVMECKFRNLAGAKSDVKVALYFQSRFQDVAGSLKKHPEMAGLNFEGWLVTNGKFSEDALQYGNCIGLNLLGWDYPEKNGLLQMIRNTGLLPVTLLHTLSNRDKEKLLEEGIVICKDLSENRGVLDKLGTDHKRRDRILEELAQMGY